MAFNKAVTTYAEAATATRSESDPLHKPKKAKIATIRALARALSPPEASTKYLIESSNKKKSYKLQFDGTDVVCSCRGFEFRGQCKHARTLKDALAGDNGVPEEYLRIE